MYLKTKEIGVHFHNNQQLAFANTIEGIIKGANYLDGTLYGLGRAAGNCPLELLLGFLKNPKFNIVPILDVIGKDIIPLRKEIEWGYHIPYMLAGILDQHPQLSMDWMASKNQGRLRRPVPAPERGPRRLSRRPGDRRRPPAPPTGRAHACRARPGCGAAQDHLSQQHQPGDAHEHQRARQDNAHVAGRQFPVVQPYEEVNGAAVVQPGGAEQQQRPRPAVSRKNGAKISPTVRCSVPRSMATPSSPPLPIPGRPRSAAPLTGSVPVAAGAN